MAVHVQSVPGPAAQEVDAEVTMIIATLSGPDPGSGTKRLPGDDRPPMNRAHDDPYDIAIQSCGGRLRVLLRGELDIAGVDLLDEVVGVVQGAQLPFSLDCHELTFIDCTGVGALLRAARRGGEIDGVHGRVQRVFEILGLNPEFTPLPAD